LIIAVFLACLDTASAVRVLEQLEDPAELGLSQITLPTSDTGTLSYRACDACRLTSLRVDTTTKYLVNDSELPLADFVRVAEEIRAVRGAAERTLVVVFSDIETGRVTRVSLRRR
jgi:hypothetical protein